ncbi:MAG TPA: WGxxGxxG family protein [Pyrinomonadaceae bacterium]|jgi:MYXO-CTERM domain-containing protein
MTNNERFSKFMRVGLLSLTLLASAGATAAQNNDNRVADNRDDDRRVAVRDNRDDDTDWGWLGLLGLAGLLGLMPRKKHEVHVRDTPDARDRNAGDRR